MKILLTGASGFIGRYVLKLLIENGHDINVLVRDPSKLICKNNRGIKVFKGNINDYDSVFKSMEDCVIVIHLAALVSSSAKYPSDFYRSNLQGTRNMLTAAEKNKTKKFIFTSSLSAHAFSHNAILNEDAIIKSEKYFSKYAETKGRAEELVMEYSKKGLSYIIIYPARVFGIGPLTDSNGASKALSLYLKNKLPFLIDHGNQYASWTFVEDAAKGIVSAALSSISNERFILGGENKTLDEVYRMADNITGKKHLKINLKSKTALSIASILEFKARLIKKQPLITREWLSFVLESQKVSSHKAETQLNYKITPFNQSLEKTIGWLNTL
jgi:nucleoside-diphosphate-sugar epimerase